MERLILASVRVLATPEAMKLLFVLNTAFPVNVATPKAMPVVPVPLTRPPTFAVSVLAPMLKAPKVCVTPAPAVRRSVTIVVFPPDRGVAVEAQGRIVGKHQNAAVQRQRAQTQRIGAGCRTQSACGQSRCSGFSIVSRQNHKAGTGAIDRDAASRSTPR